MGRFNKICDVPKCKGKVFMGWNPIKHTDKGLKVCKPHWEKHWDKKDSFSLWKIIGLEEPKSRKEELLEADIKVTRLAVGGIKVQCKECSYKGEVLTEMDDSNEIKCPNCDGKLTSEREKRMAKKKKTKAKVKKAKAKAGKKAERKLKRMGKTSGLGIFATWEKVLRENETKHLTDPQLLVIMKKEFPGQAEKSKVFSSVATHRKFYNTGIHVRKTKPKKLSKKYG